MSRHALPEVMLINGILQIGHEICSGSSSAGRGSGSGPARLLPLPVRGRGEELDGLVVSLPGRRAGALAPTEANG